MTKLRSALGSIAGSVISSRASWHPNCRATSTDFTLPHGSFLRRASGLVDQLRQLGTAIEQLETRIVAWHRTSDVSRRLATIPGIGPITASAIAAAVPDGSLFRSGRQFAAWLGLTPKAHSSGGKERQVGISKQGDGYLRRLLVVGATAVMRLARQDNASRRLAAKLLERKSAKLAAVALANKTARIAWAVMTRGETYTAPAV